MIPKRNDVTVAHMQCFALNDELLLTHPESIHTVHTHLPHTTQNAVVADLSVTRTNSSPLVQFFNEGYSAGMQS
jgi:hypothetical protein